ncbi:hypothetical protein EHI8A_110130 [Entamoeba histolytica HM-1:IMSS-B]|uniref:Uncharacterized protein n=6 Tax=Entamoeba histolytica TaxID=5759 RepID=C4LZ83_ENTH1|nr:hypothetical protein EHI_104750 [Entamoeba histolytica HM-1:IMSS]EMD43885.1 Hypothetical protein EHI5A_136070 [Entamoeba histolytica KU27]EMH73252.1 hypothetical protein EHI8A_110130 [Entamoeba histolytica HM-1:IMSS-B]EMS16084.1 hypothetical protein KM1_025880 [Entamoeba histolytica HM-3:IMSS]ENY62829.1 hypothetical protein EHI7A_102250 [Entamoeba histolytica HM-1:IMSS-A]GAT94162.1 hypothetical protein CL6EHI_104750 [Entamoeba histolytica]|eukprot:XP_650587.1 hypothetical protein EHI_104750 [Entamoeba histolytica HM-1:IMSS]
MDPVESLMIEIHSLQEEIGFLHQKIETLQLDNYDSRLTLMEIELSKKTVAYEELEEKYVQSLGKQSVLSKEKSLLETKEKYMLVEYQSKLQELQEWCENLKQENKALKSGKKFDKKQKITKGVIQPQPPQTIKKDESVIQNNNTQTNPFLDPSLNQELNNTTQQPSIQKNKIETNPFLDPSLTQQPITTHEKTIETNPFLDPSLNQQSTTPLQENEIQTNPFIDSATKQQNQNTNPFTDNSSQMLNPLNKTEKKETNPFLDESLINQMTQQNSTQPKSVSKGSSQVNVIIHSTSTNEIKEKVPEKKQFVLEKPQVVIKPEFSNFGVDDSSSDNEIITKSTNNQTKGFIELKEKNEVLKKENEKLKLQLTESIEKNNELESVMKRSIDDKTTIIQTLQNNIVTLENQLKQSTFKQKQLESKLEDYTKASSEEVEENNKYLLLNGICVALKMGNPDYEKTHLSVSTLFEQVKNKKIPLCQWPLYVSTTFDNEVNERNESDVV